jgi:hypothetical protein
MSTHTSSPRTLTVRTLALMAVALVLPLACGVNPQPTEYDDTYEKNFMLGCTTREDSNGNIPAPDEEGEPNPDARALASESECVCIYEGLLEKVPFDEAKEFEEQQADVESGDEIEIPDSISKIIDGCSKPG